MSRYVSYRDFDWLLLTFVLLLCGLGVMEIQSATVHTKFAGAHIKQLYWIGGGVAGMFLFSLLNYQALLDKIHWMYIAAIGSLMAVMVLAQPDLGTALTYMPIAIMGLFLGGLRAKQALIVVVLAGLMMPLAWHKLKPYQKERLVSFIEPEADKQGSGYQVIQSLIAVGSGGLWGGTGTQTHLSYLPVPQTDFIFAAFAEEHGFIGALGVLLLYFIVLMRLTQNA